MFLEEIKKIWKPIILLVIALVSLVYFFMFLHYDVKNFAYGIPAKGYYETAVDMVKKYGNTLEPKEMEQVKVEMQELIAYADTYIANNEIAQQYNINTIEDFSIFRQNVYDNNLENIYDDMDSITADLYDESTTGNVASKLRAYNQFIESYTEYEKQIVNIDNSNHLEYQRAMELLSDNSKRSIFSQEVLDHTVRYLTYLLILITLSVCILTAPVAVKDRSSNMVPLQWSSRRGRTIFKVQLKANILSAFLMTTIMLIVFGSIFPLDKVRMFVDSSIVSFITQSYAWVNWTYGVWCVALIMMCYVISISTSVITFVLSYYSSNYISMLLKVLPLFVVITILINGIMDYPFFYSFFIKNNLYMLTGIPMIEIIVTVTIFIIGVVMVLIFDNRTKKVDLSD